MQIRHNTKPLSIKDLSIYAFLVSKKILESVPRGYPWLERIPLCSLENRY